MICTDCSGLGWIYNPMTRKYDVACGACRGEGKR